MKRPFLILFCAFVFSSLIAEADAGSLRMRGSAAAPVNPACLTKTEAQDLCTEGLAAGGLYYFNAAWAPNTTSGWSAFSTYARQSGQSWSMSEPDAYFGGIHYGIGPNILDAAMIPASTSNGSNIPGCAAYSASLSLNCTATCVTPGTLVNFTSIYFNGGTFSFDNAGGCKVRLSNSTIKVTYETCLYDYNGGSFTGAILDIELYNNKIIYSDECRPDAELWGTTAASGVGLVQQAAWNGTIVAGAAFAPGLMTVNGSCVGSCRMSSNQYITWPGRTIATTGGGTFTQQVQLNWRVRWMGKITSSGGNFTIVSTDGASPGAQAVVTAGMYLSWGDHLNNGLARGGLYINSCSGSAPRTCVGSGATISGIGGTPTDVIVGDQDCLDAACANSLWAVSEVPTTGTYAAASMTSGPRAGGGFTVGSSIDVCAGFKARFNFFQTANSWVTASACPTDIQGNAQEITSGHLSYTQNAENAGFVGHLNGVVSMQPLIPGMTTGSTGYMGDFKVKYNAQVVTNRNVQGSITAPYSHFTARSGQDYFTNWPSVKISRNIGVANKVVTNGWYDGALSNQGGYLLKQLGQTLNSIATSVSASIADNGNGTGTFHVTAGTNIGSIAVGDYIFCSTVCSDYFTGPMRLTAQIATAGGDVSTWTTSYYRALAGTATNRRIVRYLPTVQANNFDGNMFDATGFDGPITIEPTTINPSYSCVAQKNMLTGANYIGFGCN